MVMVTVMVMVHVLPKMILPPTPIGMLFDLSCFLLRWTVVASYRSFVGNSRSECLFGAEYRQPHPKLGVIVMRRPFCDRKMKSTQSTGWVDCRRAALHCLIALTN
jgi:hypothetical protein